MEHINSFALSSPTKLSSDGTKNSSKPESGTTDSGSWPRSQEEMRRYTTSNLVNDEPGRKDCVTYQAFWVVQEQVKRMFSKCLSEANLRDSKEGQDKHLRTRERFQSGGRISREGHDLSK